MRNPYLLILAGLLTSFAVRAQAPAQLPTLLDDFNRADSPTVGQGWVETETTTGTGAAIVSNQLKLSSGVLGKDFVSRDVSSRYSPVLRQNADQLTWLFNMQQSRPNPSGFGPNNYGAAFVLAGSASDFTTGNGYAVVYGNSGAPDSLKLVRYTGGLAGPTNLRTLAAVSVPAATGATTGPAHTVRVLYAPDEDNWTLEVSANTTTFDDPTTATYVRIGVRKDSSLATTALPWVGCFWNHATTAAENAVFDNIYVTAPCTLGPEPTQAATAAVSSGLSSGGVTLSWTAGNGTGRLVVVRPASATTTAPTDGSVYNGNAVFGSGSQLGTGGFVVYAGTGSTVNVTNLQPNTAYAYQVYELLGTGCTTNYLQATPATGTFTTSPCVLASFPTQDATAATVAAAGRTAATVSWTPGNGVNHLVVLRPNSSVLTLPTSGTGYTAGAAYGSGSALGSGYVVYAGAGASSVTVTNLVPGAAYRLEVYTYNGTGCSAAYRTSFFATAVYTVPVPPVGTLLAFRGNIHAHSSYSDGNQDGAAVTPLQDFQYAAASLHSDFLGISEHNHSQAGMSLPNYARGLQQADQATTASFLALYGMEWGVISGGGHVVVYGVNQLLGWEPGNYDVYVARNDYQALFREINRRPGAFATLAHPNRTDYGNLAGTAFSPRADSAIVGTVLRSGPATSTNTSYTNPSRGSYTPYFQTLLAKGYHVGIGMDHDNHNTTFLRTAQSRLVVLAPALTKADMIDALRQRHFYASDDWNAEVTFTLNSQLMGSIFADVTPASMSVSVSDADNEAVSSVRVLRGVPGSGAKPVVVASATAGATALSYVDPQGVNTTAYYYAVVAQADGDSIVTSPIWYTRRIITATTPSASEVALSVFPNPTAGTATLSYYLQTAGVVQAEVVDAVGRRVVSLATGERQLAGAHTMAVPALTPGLYTVRLTHEAGTAYRKLVVE
ncbi:T9SS type A sorting domain-containing protein [Hymenobacter convexus]|uniref:T9SS type A sorting domain-containing protein n=1 Tax=Hymenobacter sp. CA1UV-4 TaxID=3063782 RepID=UPI0027125968|nr:T9SS type A sorting domain-containing protein [Hymenobacter sp. CA1UV-4]MDO7850398.1 T9SS type A sorting domain-containing protein [Hymenobacter sp. CA1UV-4]